MGFFSKLANVASGGLLGMAKGVAKGDPRAIMSGGMLSGGRRPGPGGAPQMAANPEAEAALAGMDPAEAARVRAGAAGHSGGLNAGVNDWFKSAVAAGSFKPPGGAGPLANAIAGAGMAGPALQGTPSFEAPVVAQPPVAAGLNRKDAAAARQQRIARRGAWGKKLAKPIQTVASAPPVAPGPPQQGGPDLAAMTQALRG